MIGRTFHFADALLCALLMTRFVSPFASDSPLGTGRFRNECTRNAGALVFFGGLTDSFDERLGRSVACPVIPDAAIPRVPFHVSSHIRRAPRARIDSRANFAEITFRYGHAIEAEGLNLSLSLSLHFSLRTYISLKLCPTLSL